MRPKNIPTGDLVVSPLNVREDVGDIRTLAESIQQEGLLHPLTVRPYGEVKYEIVAGRRRYESCKLIGMKLIPCNIAEEMDDRRAVLVSLKENMRRGDITAAEKKRAIAKLLEMDGGDTPAREERRRIRRRHRVRLKAALLGRSRGGQTSKVHRAADRKCRPLALILTAGQAADSPQFIPVPKKIRVRGPVGRPRTRPDAVAGDRHPMQLICQAATES